MYQLLRFSSGLKLITAPVSGTEAVTVLILLPVGSRYENKNLNGVSHFIEHMMFKGTKKRPSNLAIAKELDAIGAEYNAFTGKDLTGYWVKLDKNYLEIGLEILADIFFNSLFDKDEFEREKGVILEEIKMYEDNPLFYIETLFEQTLYGEHPLGWPIAGEMKNIKKLSHAELLDFKNKYYQVNRTLITVAGNIKAGIIKKLVAKFFKSTANYKSNTSFTPKQARYGAGIQITNKKFGFQKFLKRKQENLNFKILTKDVQQVQLALGFPAYSYFHPKLEALILLSIILGGNMSSRLFTEVRVKRGLAYFIKADLSVYQDAGDFVIRAGLDKDKTEEAIKVILDELKKIRDKGVSSEELNRAKTFCEGKLSLELEDSASLASWYGKRLLLTGKILTPEQRLAKIKKVRVSDIQAVVREIIQSKSINLALIGPSLSRSSILSVLRGGL